MDEVPMLLRAALEHGKVATTMTPELEIVPDDKATDAKSIDQQALDKIIGRP